MLKNSYDQVDSWIIDRLCQPIADAVYDRFGMRHFALALLAFATGGFVREIIFISRNDPTPTYVWAFWLAMLMLNEPAKVKDQGENRTMNPNRYKRRTRWTRYFMITIMMLNIANLVKGIPTTPAGIVMYVASFVMVSSFFFAACSQRPRKRQEKRSLVPANGTA